MSGFVLIFLALSCLTVVVCYVLGVLYNSFAFSCSLTPSMGVNPCSKFGIPKPKTFGALTGRLAGALAGRLAWKML